MSRNIALELRKVTKFFRQNDHSIASPRLILDGVNLTVTSGLITGVLGKTGAGKTTLGKIISGMLLPDSGGAMLDGRSVFGRGSSESRALRRELRYVAQNPDAALSSRLRVDEAMSEAERHSGVVGNELKAWRHVLLHPPLFRAEWLSRRMFDLSLGERKRVVNLRALLTHPRFIVLDEPFNGLDLRSKGAFMDHLRLSAYYRDIGVIVISHDTEALLQLANRIVTLENGRLVDYPGTSVS